MDNLPNGFSVFASMLGGEASVLCAISAPWVSDPSKPPITPIEFVRLLAEGNRLADGLNNTNLWEQAITQALRPMKSRPPPADVPRPANHDDKE
jgi:hypothetical protein